jgi:formylglycine-generating enzyme required for sulfatase activity
MNKFTILATVACVALGGCAAGLQGGSLFGGSSSASAQPGASFRDCATCPEMVVIPPGSFTMGSPAGEEFRRDHEREHKVTIAYKFAVSKTEVTWDQWEACVRDGACDGAAIDTALRLDREGKPNPDFKDWGRGNRPVVGVSWYDAQTYVGWLNKKTSAGDAYRLLSEAEWEYAARGGTTTAFPWGDKLDHNYGNFGIPGPGLGGKAEGRDTWLDQTAPTASFPANAFGLHDMHGNAFEWIEDCYEADLTKLPADGSANKTGSCSSRMFRSGSFISNPVMHRSANRVRGYAPTTRGRNYLTIRVAKTI